MYNALKHIIANHLKYKKQILALAKAKNSKQFSGTTLGWVWGIMRTIIRLGFYYVCFAFGLRSGKPVNGYPYFLWFATGYISFSFVRKEFMSGSSTLRSNKYLVTKIKFPVELVCTISTTANMLLHLATLPLLILFFIIMKCYPTVYWLQLPIYLVLMYLFGVMWRMFSCVFGTFSKDFSMTIKSFGSVFIWISGVFFKLDTINNRVIRNILLMNPSALMVRGYRNVFINNKWIWETKDWLRILISFVIMLFLSIWAQRKYARELPDML